MYGDKLRKDPVLLLLGATLALYLLLYLTPILNDGQMELFSIHVAEPILLALVIFAMWNPARAVLGAILFGGINAVQFRLQAAGTTIPAAFLNMLPYLATVIVLVAVTWWENLSKRLGAPAALTKPYIREEK